MHVNGVESVASPIAALHLEERDSRKAHAREGKSKGKMVRLVPLPLLLFSPTSSYLAPVRTPRSRPSSVVLSVVADIAADTAGVAAMDETALELDLVRPVRGSDGRLQPVLTLPGDTLETTKLMMWVTVLSTSLATGVVARAFAINLAGGMLPIWPLLGVAAGWTVGELFSGAFHWATDNYGRLQTPVVGFACAAFQGHHLAPWTISHRSVYNNVYKIGAATIPLILSALWLLPPTGAAFVATMFYSQLLAQEFHRWTHTPPPLLAPWQRQLQQVGIALPLKEHIAHHKPPFDKHYCILTGGLNAVLDSRPVLFWRRLEALVYRANGQEPNSWKDPRVKELALSL